MATPMSMTPLHYYWQQLPSAGGGIARDEVKGSVLRWEWEWVWPAAEVSHRQ